MWSAIFGLVVLTVAATGFADARLHGALKFVSPQLLGGLALLGMVASSWTVVNMIGVMGQAATSGAQPTQADASRFVGSMLTSPDARVIVKSTIRLAQEMGLKTVAEGVETQDVHDRLVDFGVDHVQGYHISRPMAANQVSAWMTAWPAS